MIQFKVLGPLAARSPAGVVPLGPPRHQKILAMLLLNADHVVAVPKIVDVLWADNPPASARQQVQNSVSALRRRFEGTAGVAGDLITVAFSGVQLRSESVEIDLHLLDALEMRALAAGDPQQAAGDLRRALDLWTGPGLAGLTGPYFESAGAAIDERRLAIYEQCLDTELAVRPAAHLIAELAGLVADHPLRERLVGLLMVALYRSGRQADALAAFRGLRVRLREELGIEPSRRLADLELAILRLDPKLDGTPPTTGQAGVRSTAIAATPRQLPRRPRALAGRDVELATIRDALGSGGRSLASGGHQEASVVICCHGGGGIGKSALVLAAAHAAAEAFPDGQVYANLQGAGAGLTPVEPAELIGRFLRAFDIPGNRIPNDLDEASALWRTVLADKRVLIVLDNAATAAQVRSILPATAGSAVLVTSRPMLASLDDAVHIDVPLLGVEAANSLLTALAGEACPDEATVAEVVELCGRLPLALRIAGARLALDPKSGLGALVEELRDERRRLSGLAVDDLALRTAFLPTYRQVQIDAPGAASMFRLVSLAGLEEIGVVATAALMDVDLDTAHAALRFLVDVRLAESPADGRFQMHDLLRLFALERLHDDETSVEREAAWSRIVEHYRHGVYLAGELVRAVPPNINTMPTAGTLASDVTFGSRDDAIGWLERERRAVVAIAAQASTRDDDTSTFAEDARRYMMDFLNLGSYSGDTAAIAMLGMGTAERLGRFDAAAFCASGLAMVQVRTRRLSAAQATARHGIEFAQRAHNQQKEANCRLVLALALLRSGQYDESTAEFERAMGILRDIDSRYSQAVAMHNRAEILLEFDRAAEAGVLLKQSLQIRADFDDPTGWLLGQVTLGKAQCLQGRIDEARVTLGRALKSSVELHNRMQEMQILIVLAKIELMDGDPTSGKERAEQALSTAHRLDEPYGEVLAMKLIAAALEALGHAEAAGRHIAAAEQLQHDRSPTSNASLDRVLALRT